MAKNKVDQINDAFIKILSRENSRQYAEYIKAINREMINNIDNLTTAKVKEIIRGAKINIDDIALLFVIQNAILLIVGKKMTKAQRLSIAPIIVLMGMYSLKRPERFVKKLVHISKGKGLSVSEKKAQAIIRGFKQDNEKVLKDARKIARQQLDTSRIKSKTSRRMIKDLNKGIADKKSITQIKSELVRKYNKLSNVERALDTELHAQSEYVRQEHSKAMGFTHKLWHTQGDSRVRTTQFHKDIADKRVPINSDFRAAGLNAGQPGDVRLPPSDRIRCRCYLTYE